MKVAMKAEKWAEKRVGKMVERKVAKWALRSVEQMADMTAELKAEW